MRAVRDMATLYVFVVGLWGDLVQPEVWPAGIYQQQQQYPTAFQSNLPLIGNAFQPVSNHVQQSFPGYPIADQNRFATVKEEALKLEI